MIDSDLTAIEQVAGDEAARCAALPERDPAPAETSPAPLYRVVEAQAAKGVRAAELRRDPTGTALTRIYVSDANDGELYLNVADIGMHVSLFLSVTERRALRAWLLADET